MAALRWICRGPTHADPRVQACCDTPHGSPEHLRSAGACNHPSARGR